MQRIFRSKYSLIFSIIILIAVFFYLFNSTNPNTNPKEVITPENYPEGSTLELWENAPPEFPKELILENNKIDHADVLTSANGKKQIAVSYTSTLAMPELAQMYIDSFENSGWKMISNNISPRVGTMLVTRGAEILVISVTPKEGGGSLVAFQYEK